MNGTATDLTALREALDEGAAAAHSASSGDAEGTMLGLKKALAAAEVAFPDGSRESFALSVVLQAIRDASDGDSAAGPACKGASDPDLWFRPGCEGEAKAVCGRCPVRAECLEQAITADAEVGGAFGVWGGFDAEERRLLLDYGTRAECSACGQLKLASEFGSDGNGGVRETCLDCRAAAERASRRRRKEKYAVLAAPQGMPAAGDGRKEGEDT